MNDDQQNLFSEFSPISPSKKLSNQKTDRHLVNDFQIEEVQRSMSKMSLNPPSLGAMTKRSMVQLGGSQRQLVSKRRNGVKLTKANLPPSKPNKRLVYFNEQGLKDFYDIDKEEYERLKLQVGVDFDTENQDFHHQQVLSMFVKTLQKGLPSNWVRETDINESIVYYNRLTQETTYQHPLSKILRKTIKYYYQTLQENKELVKQMESKGSVIVPLDTERIMEFQKRVESKKRNSMIMKIKSGAVSGTKIVMGSSNALKILKKNEMNTKPRDVFEAISFKDTRSDMRLRHLFNITKSYKDQVFEQYYGNQSSQEFNSVMEESFYHYQKKFLKILTSPINVYYYQRSKNSSELHLPDSSFDQKEDPDGENNLVPELPPYVLQNDYFKNLSMEQQIELAIYYGINPATEYYLLWIPRLALSLRLFNRWVKSIHLLNQKEEFDYIVDQKLKDDTLTYSKIKTDTIRESNISLRDGAINSQKFQEFFTIFSAINKVKTACSSEGNQVKAQLMNLESQTQSTPENMIYYKHVVTQLVIDFHPADPFIRYMVQVYQNKNFEMKADDNINREYDQKIIFCEMLGIENIIKHSIYIKLQQFQQQQKNKTPENLRWATPSPQRSSLKKNSKSLQYLDLKNEEEHYEHLTDAEIFALASQCGLNLETELHLLSYLVMIAMQVKAQHQFDLEFRYIKEGCKGQASGGVLTVGMNNLRGIKSRQGLNSRIKNSIAKMIDKEKSQPLYYWRDITNEKNHKVFPLLNEIKQKFDVIKANLGVFLEGPRFRTYLKDLNKFKTVFKGDPEVFRNQIMHQKHLLVEKYLTTLLEKGRIDPNVFKLERTSKSGKQYFRVTKDDIDRIFHLLGNKVKHPEILDFCFESPFKFDLSEQELEHHKRLIRDLESEERKWRFVRPQFHYEETSEIDYEEGNMSSRTQRNTKKIARGLSFSSMMTQNFDRQDSVNARAYAAAFNNPAAQTLEEEDDSSDDDAVKRLMKKRLQEGNNYENLDDLNQKFLNPVRKSPDPEQVILVPASPPKEKQQSPLKESRRSSPPRSEKKKPKPESEKKIIFKQAKAVPKLETEEEKKQKLLEMKAKSGLRGGMFKNKKDDTQTGASTTNRNQQIHANTKGRSGGLNRLSGKSDFEKDMDGLNIDIGNNVDFAAMFSNNNKRKHQGKGPHDTDQKGRYIDADGNLILKPSREIEDLLGLQDEKALVSKLKEVLVDINLLTKGITNLIKEPTGSNPLVNKLADIIYNTNFDPEDFIASITNFQMGGKDVEGQDNEEILKKLVSSIQNIHEKKLAQKAETFQEAQIMAENYFNMLMRRKKNTNGEAGAESRHEDDHGVYHHPLSKLSPLKGGRGEDDFIAVSKKMSIYDRLVKALFKMAKQRVDDLDPENLQRIAEEQIHDQKRRQSVIFSNFVYIKNKRAIEPSDNALGEQFKLLMQFQGHFNNLSDDLGLDDNKKNDKNIYAALKRQDDLLTDSQKKMRESKIREYYQNKNFELTEEMLRLKLHRSEKLSQSWKQDSLTETVSQQSEELQNEDSLSEDTQNLTAKSQHYKQNLRRQSLNDDVKQIDEDENEYQNLSHSRAKSPSQSKGKSFKSWRGKKQQSVETQLEEGQLNYFDQNQTAVEQKKVEVIKRIIKFKVSATPRLQSNSRGWRISAKEEMLNKAHSIQNKKFLIDPQVDVKKNQKQNHSKNFQQNSNIQNAKDEERQEQSNVIDTNIKLIFEENFQRRAFMHYYSTKIGDPLISDPVFLNTEQYFRPESLSPCIQPKHIIKIARLFGLSINTKVQKRLDNLTDRINKPLYDIKCGETDLMWIPYLLILVEIPENVGQTVSDQGILKKIDVIKSLLETGSLDILCKLQDLLIHHPAFDYLCLLLKTMRSYRQRKLDLLIDETERLNFIQDCSWLVFKEQLLHHKMRECSHQYGKEKDYSLYYYNFKTQRKQYLMPENLMKSVEEYQNKLVPNNLSLYTQHNTNLSLFQSAKGSAENSFLNYSAANPPSQFLQMSTKKQLHDSKSIKAQENYILTRQKSLPMSEEAEIARLQDSLLQVLKRKVTGNEGKFSELDSTKDTQHILGLQDIYRPHIQKDVKNANSIIRIEDSLSNNFGEEQSTLQPQQPLDISQIKKQYKTIRITQKSNSQTQLPLQYKEQKPPVIDLLIQKSLRNINSPCNQALQNNGENIQLIENKARKTFFLNKRRSWNEQIIENDILMTPRVIINQQFQIQTSLPNSSKRDIKAKRQFSFSNDKQQQVSQRGLLTSRCSNQAFVFPDLKVSVKTKKRQNLCSDQQKGQLQSAAYNSYFNQNVKHIMEDQLAEQERQKIQRLRLQENQGQQPLNSISRIKLYSQSTQHAINEKFPPEGFLQSKVDNPSYQASQDFLKPQIISQAQKMKPVFIDQHNKKKQNQKLNERENTKTQGEKQFQTNIHVGQLK